MSVSSKCLIAVFAMALLVANSAKIGFGTPPAVAERTGSELERLRKENAELRQELAIYKLKENDVDVDYYNDRIHINFRAEKFSVRRQFSFHQPRWTWHGLLRHIRDFHSPVNVLMGATSVQSSDLEVLKNCDNILRLDLGGSAITDAGMATVGTLENLEYLSVRNCRLTDAGLVPLSNLRKLRSMNLETNLVNSGYQFTEKGIQHLAQLTELRQLNLGFAELNDRSMAHLADLTNLESLSLLDSSVADNGLRRLQGMKKLQRLNLWRCVNLTDEGLSHLSSLPRLRLIDAVYTKMTKEGVQKLQEKLPELKVRLTNADPYYQ